MACSWEVIFEFMERAGHDSIGKVEGFLNSISMVDINVDVQDSLVCFEELKDG